MLEVRSRGLQELPLVTRIVIVCPTLLSACLVKREGGENFEGGDGTGGGGGSTAKILAREWSISAFSVDMRDAVTDGSTFSASFIYGHATKCVCTMAMTGTQGSLGYK